MTSAGPMLELVVDNALCDAAALLREEQKGSGRFLVVHGIGLPEQNLVSVIDIQDPPAFFHTSAMSGASSDSGPVACAGEVAAALGVPFLLWAYDQGSGYALVIGNRMESNASRPFEPGDQEFIESALSIYLDVLYRKHAEAQLRQAKQAAEAARDSRAAFLVKLAEQLQEPIDAMVRLYERWHREEAASRSPAQRLTAREATNLARLVRRLVDQAAAREADAAQPLVLDTEWVEVDDFVRGVVRVAYTESIKCGVEIGCRLPARRCAILMDRRHMGDVVQMLATAAIRATPTGGNVRVAANRRSDGGLEIVFSSRGAGMLAVAHASPEKSLDAASWWEGADLQIARHTVAAHSGVLTTESSAFGGTTVRLIMPANCTRDAAMSGDDAA